MQPTQKSMTTQPTQNELPAEVREAIQVAAVFSTGADSMMPASLRKLTDDLCSALAPLWPKPTQPSKAEVIHELTARYGPLEKTAQMLPPWSTGTPDVADGKREVFWCATRNSKGKVFHRHLFYLNKHIMPLSDNAYEAPACAIPVNDDGDYEWTGWCQESCDHCETQWMFDGEVIAWMRLPKFNVEAKQ